MTNRNIEIDSFEPVTTTSQPNDNKSALEKKNKQIFDLSSFMAVFDETNEKCA